MPWMHIGRLLVPSALLMLGAGCAGLGGGSKDALPARIDLIETPRAIRGDYSYPDAYTRHLFLWNDFGANWRIYLPSRRYAHSGIRFIYPHDLSGVRDTYFIELKIRPAKLANHLWVGLVDSKKIPGRVMVDAPMRAEGEPVYRGTDAVKIRIPLDRFGGDVLLQEADDTGDDGAIDLSAGSDGAVFDWSDVRELRIISPGSRLPAREITIEHLELRR